MDPSDLLAAPRTGRSRFSKALPAPPAALASNTNITTTTTPTTSEGITPFPQLPAIPFPSRQQGLGMATMSAAAPSLAPALEPKPMVSPLPALPRAPFANDNSQLPSPALSAIKRKPVRKPVPEPAAFKPTPREMKRVSSISSLLSAYSNSSTDSANRSSHTSDDSKDSENSPASDLNDNSSSVSQANQPNVHAALRSQPAITNATVPAPTSERPRTPPVAAQLQTSRERDNAATNSPGSGRQETTQHREVWRRRASSNRSDRSIAVSDLKLVITHGSTAATGTGAAAQVPRGNRSVDEKALPPLVQGRGVEPAGSTMNTLPFRNFSNGLHSQPSQPQLQAKQNSNKEQPLPPPPPPPKQNNAPVVETQSRLSDAGSMPGSVLGDILSNYSFPTPPPVESTTTTPKAATISDAPGRPSETNKFGRKPVGSPPAVQLKDEAVTPARHPAALTPGTNVQNVSVPTPITGNHLEVKVLPRIPGVGLRPGDKSRSPLPFEKSPRVVPAPKNNDSVVSPVAEEMGKIKDKFKAFVHKRTSSTDASPPAPKTNISTTQLADVTKNVGSPVVKELPTLPSMPGPKSAIPSPEKPVPNVPESTQVDAAPVSSLPQIEESPPMGDLTTQLFPDSHMGGLNVIIPQSKPQQQQQQQQLQPQALPTVQVEQGKMTTSSSTASLATMQTATSQSKPPSSISTADSRGAPQDKRPMDPRNDFAGGRARAGTTTSMASNMGPPPGRGLRTVASAQTLHGPPPSGFRSTSRPRGATNETLPPFAPSPMYNPFRQRPQTSSGPTPKGPRPLDGRELYHLADSLSKNPLVRRHHDERADSFPVREADASLSEQDQATIQTIRKLFPLQAEQSVPSNTDIRVAPPITDRHYNCWFRHENWVTSQNEHNSVECQTCHKKEKDPRMVCCGCDVRICYDCYERLMVEKRDLRAMVNKLGTV